MVTATRVETPAKEIASSITVITRQDLDWTRKTFVLEALISLIGLSTLQNGGPRETASVFIRGANAEHTLVLLDGIELNDPINPSRSYDLAHLPISQVDRIEILSGPQSPLYGSDAPGGVINIITRKGCGRPQLSVTASAGFYQSIEGDVEISGSSAGASYSFGVFHGQTAGISAASVRYPGNAEPDGYRNFSLSGKFSYAVRNNISLRLTARSVRTRTEIDNFGGPYGDDPNDVQKYGSTLISTQAQGLFLDNRWEQKLSLSCIKSERSYINPTDQVHLFESESGAYGSTLFKLDWQNNFFLAPSNTLTAGLDIEREEGRSDYVSENQWGTYESLFPSDKTGSVGLYLQDQWRVQGKFFFAGGARLDLHSRTGTALTYRLAPAYVAAKTGTKFKATIGTGFRSPSLYQLFAPETAWVPVGNIKLLPERAPGWDAGIEQLAIKNRICLGLTFFQNSFKNLIDFDFQEGYVNIGKARMQGVEISFESRPLEAFQFKAAYTRLRARDLISGTALLRRPRDKFSADVQLRVFNLFDASISFLFVGKRTDRDFSNIPYQTITLPAYTLLNAAFSVSISRSFVLFMRLDNILGTRYEAIWGYGTIEFSVRAGIRMANKE